MNRYRVSCKHTNTCQLTILTVYTSVAKRTVAGAKSIARPSIQATTFTCMQTTNFPPRPANCTVHVMCIINRQIHRPTCIVHAIQHHMALLTHKLTGRELAISSLETICACAVECCIVAGPSVVASVSKGTGSCRHDT